VFIWLSKNEAKTVQDAVEALDLKLFSESDLALIIDEILHENKLQIEKMGKNAFGMLMGVVMKKVRGKANPELVSKLIHERIT